MTLQKNIGYLLATCLLLMPLITEATNLRGRIDAVNKYTKSPYPIGRVSVVLYLKKNKKWKSVGRYTTGTNGMYFFQNIKPGRYTIQVNRRSNYPITVVNKKSQDLPKIVLKY